MATLTTMSDGTVSATITSDGAEQLIILGHGALRISARSFREEVERTNGEIRRILEENRLKNARR